MAKKKRRVAKGVMSEAEARETLAEFLDRQIQKLARERKKLDQSALELVRLRAALLA